MKKRLLSLLLTLLLGFSLAGAAAWADNTIIVNLGTAESGAYADRLLGTTERGSADVSGGALPDGCQIVTETRDGAAYHYLRGTPMTAGNYEFTLSIAAPNGDDELELITELKCSLTVLPATPAVAISPDADCNVGEETSLTATASAADGGALSYQWYANTARSSQGGSAVIGATEATLRLTPAASGTSYYYCLVTNTNNGQTATAVTQAAAVTARERLPVSLTVATQPAKLYYTQGERLDTTGVRLTLSYSDGGTETVTEGFSAEPLVLSDVGSQVVTLRYRGLTCSYTVQVAEEEEVVLDLQVVTLPAKLDYAVGDWLDTAGMTLRVDTNKGSYDVSTGFTCLPRVLEQEGRQTVTVQYGSLSTSFTVNVASADKRVESIVVTRRPAKLSYTVGDYFDPLGLALTVQTNQGAEEITEGFTWSPQQFTTAGRQSVTISYEGKTCTLELVVDLPAVTAAPEESPAPTATPEPESSPTATARPNTHVERKSGQTAVVVIVVAALVGLAALLAYVYLTKKEKLTELTQKLRARFKK